ncbi:MAG TPA: GIY-YIG nuclease family protein [Candidatus Paceibacterota bacterium]|nr:GIY-YIG nuclease family protein [Candidatus Paceibacterota bacterium]
MYTVYILKSLSDGDHYVGMSGNVTKRLSQHNSGVVRSTKSRTPFVLLYTENFSTRLEAREREKFLKSYKGAAEKASILKDCQIV